MTNDKKSSELLVREVGDMVKLLREVEEKLYAHDSYPASLNSDTISAVTLLAIRHLDESSRKLERLTRTLLFVTGVLCILTIALLPWWGRLPF